MKSPNTEVQRRSLAGDQEAAELGPAFAHQWEQSERYRNLDWRTDR